MSEFQRVAQFWSRRRRPDEQGQRSIRLQYCTLARLFQGNAKFKSGPCSVSPKIGQGRELG